MPCSRSVPESVITAVSDVGGPAPASAAVRRTRPTGWTPRSNEAPPPHDDPSFRRHVGGACSARADRWVSAPSEPTSASSASITGEATRCSEYSTARPFAPRRRSDGRRRRACRPAGPRRPPGNRHPATGWRHRRVRSGEWRRSRDHRVDRPGALRTAPLGHRPREPARSNVPDRGQATARTGQPSDWQAAACTPATMPAPQITTSGRRCIAARSRRVRRRRVRTSRSPLHRRSRS